MYIMMHQCSRLVRKSTFATRRSTISSLSARGFAASTRHSDKFESPKYIRDNHTSNFEGALARTDSTVQLQHPLERNLPKSEPVRGSGGVHHKRTLPSFSLEGKVGAVTGGARGLGLMMSQAIIISGGDLAIVDLDKQEAERQASELLKTFKRENSQDASLPKITAHYADVADSASVESAVAEIIEYHGKIDNLVTSAGFCENFEAINYPNDRLKKLWDVNVNGTYFFATAIARHLAERKSQGSMVFIGSMSGNVVNVPQPQAPYNASKAAVRHLAASFAVEWAAAGIRVNCISPGYMVTELTKRILSANPDLGKKWTALVPQGRLGKPEDLMGSVAFLLSDASQYVTGADLRVDGGYTLT